MSPAGVFAVLAMALIGRLLGQGTHPRWWMAIGLLMSQLNLDISPDQLVWPWVLVFRGLSVCFILLQQMSPHPSIRRWNCVGRQSVC